MFHDSNADSASSVRIVSYRTTGEKISSKSTPSTWENPLATSLAFLRPSDFIMNTQRDDIVRQFLGHATISKTLCLRRASISMSQDLYHSSLSDLGMR